MLFCKTLSTVFDTEMQQNQTINKQIIISGRRNIYGLQIFPWLVGITIPSRKSFRKTTLNRHWIPMLIGTPCTTEFLSNARKCYVDHFSSVSIYPSYLIAEGSLAVQLGTKLHLSRNWKIQVRNYKTSASCIKVLPSELRPQLS